MKALIICGLDIQSEKDDAEAILREFGLRFDDVDITIINPSEDVVKDGLFKERIKSKFQDYDFKDVKYDFIISGHCTIAGYESVFTRQTFSKIYNLLNTDGILIVDMPSGFKPGQGPLYYIDLNIGLDILSCIRLFFKEIPHVLNQKPHLRYVFQKKKMEHKGNICFEESEVDFFVNWRQWATKDGIKKLKINEAQYDFQTSEFYIPPKNINRDLIHKIKFNEVVETSDSYIPPKNINKDLIHNMKFNDVVETSDFYTNFYKNKIVNYDKVKLDDILRYNNKQLEKKHNFIQYLFPLETVSKYNPRAPVITDRFIKEAKMNRLIRSNIIRSFVRMMNFYGFNIMKDKDGLRLEIDPEGDFQWMTRANHNYMRISRMLIFLQMIDMPLLAYILFEMLCKLYLKGKIEKSTFDVWREIII